MGMMSIRGCFFVLKLKINKEEGVYG